MALGLGLMFGIRLPMNFFSPYKSANLTEFWRRWHMSLSRFLRDYVYIPMGGNRHGQPRRYFNLFFTMAVGGFWHGAAWTFLFWGAGHGVLLAINHAWQAVGKRCSWRGRPIVIPHWLGVGITLFCVILLWVPFRAPDFGTTLLLWKRMLLIDPALPSVITQLSPSFVAFASSHGIAFVIDHFLSNSQIPWITAKLLVIFAFALFAPNSNQIMRRYRPAIDEIYWRKSDMRSRIILRLDIRYAAFISAIIIYSVLYIARPSEFIYFQF
jgi:D-alanyl-lipoteichoic acid acyltransferase DltB (MBOAT superfamily)